jgi:hypothetical protein
MSKNKILFLIINFFLLICESIEDKNNIFDYGKVLNSSNILEKNTIKRKETDKYLRLLEEDTSDDSDLYVDDNKSSDDDISSDTIEIVQKINIYVSFTLLQTRKIDDLLNLYVLANSSFPENTTFNLSISVYLKDRIRNLEGKKEFINAKLSGTFKSNNRDDILKIIILSADLAELGYADNLQNIQKIILNNIDLIDDKDKEKENYIFDINLLENTDTSTQTKTDMSIYDENTIANVYIEEKISSCSNDLKFNISVNNDIDVNERNINLEFSVVDDKFKGDNNRRPFSLSVPCVLSRENKRIIPCQFEEEPPQFSLKLTTFMEYIEDQLIIIKSLNSDSSFTLECYEEPPIAAIISIVVLFFFVVIVVIIIIIVMNKKGRGDRGYELPNESNSNNILGLGGGASK